MSSIDELMQMTPEELRLAPQETFKELIKVHRQLMQQYNAGKKPKKEGDEITLEELELVAPTKIKLGRFT